MNSIYKKELFSRILIIELQLCFNCSFLIISNRNAGIAVELSSIIVYVNTVLKRFESGVMMRYKNLFAAYLIELIFGLIIIFLIFISDPDFVFLLLLFALRPFVLERVEIDIEDKFWCASYEVGKYSIITTSIIIILTFIIDEFIYSGEKIFIGSLLILASIIPVYLLIHGIAGLVWYKRKGFNNIPVK